MAMTLLIGIKIMIMRIKESELILNPDGSIYHLKLKPEDIADTILVVGDPGRVATVSAFFDSIEFKGQNREIVTHTGYYKGKHITVMSTGMGTDNLDIVINELDALANIDLTKRTVKDEHKSLNIIRLGTSGALQNDILVDSFVLSEMAFGLDGLLNFYKTPEGMLLDDYSEHFISHCSWNQHLPYPYCAEADADLVNKIGFDMQKGITATAPGFFGPQGRQLRAKLAYPELNDLIESYEYKGKRIVNFEMETSALYGLGKLLGHKCLTVCVAIANRRTKTFSKDYHPHVERLIKTVLDRF